MAASPKLNSLEKRLREIEREKEKLRERMQEVRHWADADPAAVAMRSEPRLREAALPRGYSRAEAAAAVPEQESALAPDGETSLDFGPGPDGLDVKRVVMPRLERTDLLRPAIGGGTGAKLMEPEYDRFRNYFGSAGLKRMRETRKDRGSQRVRTVFMILMVLALGFILFQMVT
ncbi:MAG: hypothetical protein AB7V14_03055 [Kiritimatiellia bacterium]